MGDFGHPILKKLIMKSITNIFEDLVEKDKDKNEIEEGKFTRSIKRGVGNGLRSVGSFLKKTYTTQSHLD